jgi:hypothetical protein
MPWTQREIVCGKRLSVLVKVLQFGSKGLDGLLHWGYVGAATLTDIMGSYVQCSKREQVLFGQLGVAELRSVSRQSFIDEACGFSVYRLLVRIDGERMFEFAYLYVDIYFIH